MDKFLRPATFEGSEGTSPEQWTHWYCTFTNFLDSIEDLSEATKLKLLINYVSPSVYSYISECGCFCDAVKVLEAVYVKPPNEIFARHKLANRRQQPSESIDQYLQSLKLLAKDCAFKNVSADTYSQESVRDAFITGLSSSLIRQRLLEKQTLTLDEAVTQARSLEMAQHNAEMYIPQPPNSYPPVAAAANPAFSPTSPAVVPPCESAKETSAVTAATKGSCFFCGGPRHPRSQCAARNTFCYKCGRKGHFSKVCKSKVGTARLGDTDESAMMLSSLSMVSASSRRSPASSHCALVSVLVNEVRATALVDSGSSNSFMHPDLASKLKLHPSPSSETVTMASSPLTIQTKGHCFVKLQVQENLYPNFKLPLLPNLCADLVLGRDFMGLHDTVEFPLGGSKPKLTVCGVVQMNLAPPSLFPHLTADCKPIATRTRRHSKTDEIFIREEVKNLLEQGIIEESQSPWRAQVLVTGNDRHRKRMVVDYSRTINKYTYLDSFPIPRIDELVHQMAKHNIFSKLDLKSAYYQIPMKQNEKLYTAFEANGRLYHFNRIPFGLTNAVSAFQRAISTIIAENKLENTFAYIDDVLICGKDRDEHDCHLRRFQEVASQYNITLNEDKCQFRLEEISYLGYLISNGSLRPDPDRLQPLRDMPVPSDLPSLRRTLGLLSYYSQWIPDYSRRIQPLLNSKTFPLESSAVLCFNMLKEDIARASVHALDENCPLEVETDASDTSIAATLSQNGRPVAFFSRTLSAAEKLHPAVEKEASAIIEAVRKWRMFLVGRKFKIITDQQAISFMFSTQHSSKIKNDKIQRWRIELAEYAYDIQFRPGKENLPADALSRVCSATNGSTVTLEKIHESLCHPGITRLFHYVKVKNLAFSLDEVKKVCLQCHVCSEFKPRYFTPPASHLIHALRPFDRLSIDFIGPKPSVTRNRYLLVMIDEYSRFPFAFPCPDMTAETVIHCFHKLFSIFGCPSSVHSDRGPQFMSKEVKQYLMNLGVAFTHSSPYYPQGNGQCEKENGTIWRAVRMALKSRGIKENQWELVLDNVLHSVRSLLCTATNETPHERLFAFPRKTTNGYSLPTWLSHPGPVLVRKFVRESKSDPLVEPVDLISATPHYAKIRRPDGRETTVSTKDLAPAPASLEHRQLADALPPIKNTVLAPDKREVTLELPPPLAPDSSPAASDPGDSSETAPVPLRRSTRLKKPVDRLNYT